MKRKEIIVNNQKDLNRFYKSLWLYKSFIYKNTEFYSNSKYDITSIINGLNIKNRRKRIDYIHDEACNEIDLSLPNSNPCEFIDGRCIVQRSNPNNHYCYGCCRFCIHCTDKGCPSKNLSCKFFNCSAVKERDKIKKYKDLNILKLLSWRGRIIVKHDYFCLREEILHDLYIDELFIVSIRIIYRIIRNEIKRRVRKIDRRV